MSQAVENIKMKSSIPIRNQLIVIKHEFGNVFSNGKEVYIKNMVFC